MERFRRLLRQPLAEIPPRREDRFIEGPSLLVALRGVKIADDVRSSLRAKLRLIKDLRKLAF